MTVAQDGCVWFGENITVELGTDPGVALEIWLGCFLRPIERLTSEQARDLAAELVRWADVQEKIRGSSGSLNP